MATLTLRPDAKGRVGLDSLTKELQARLGISAISGYAADLTADGAILLRPKVELPADEAATLVLSTRDRDAFLAAVAGAPPPGRVLKAALVRHRRAVRRP